MSGERTIVRIYIDSTEQINMDVIAPETNLTGTTCAIVAAYIEKAKQFFLDRIKMKQLSSDKYNDIRKLLDGEEDNTHGKKGDDTTGKDV